MMTMKRLMTLMALLLLLLNATAQSSLYSEKLAEFARMRAIDSTDVVMLGDDFIEYAGDWNVLLRARHIRNRGIAGDNIEGVARRVTSVTAGKPKAIFLMVGAHDLLGGKTPADLLRQYADVIRLIRRHSPKTELYVESVFARQRVAGTRGPEGQDQCRGTVQPTASSLLRAERRDVYQPLQDLRASRHL